MLIKKPSDIRSSEITPERVYFDRRQFMVAASGALVSAGVGLGAVSGDRAAAQDNGAAFGDLRKSPFSTTEDLNSFEDITTYNNFYEFGVDKDDPAEHAHRLTTKPWSIKVDGHCNKPADYNLEDILAPHPLEERIYRLRCVEAWSMVIPWVGFSLSALINRFEPTSKAKFVEFATLNRPSEMIGQRRPVLTWPYVEGLRMDEALHPLAIIAVGLYGRVLPNQNGAPLRLVVPWKYGFKSIKSIVRIRFVERQPMTTWPEMAPDEYGFYSNVNPERGHPRWSQKRERRIGDFFRRETHQFNGYADQVASLYTGMDLIRNY